MSQVMAPVIPFLTEYIWQKMVRVTEPEAPVSIMLGGFPKEISGLSQEDILQSADIARKVIASALRLRNEKSLKIKQPLRTLYVLADEKIEKAVRTFENVIKDEINVKYIEFEKNTDRFNIPFLTVNFKTAGAVLKNGVQAVKSVLQNATAEQMSMFVQGFKEGKVALEPYGELDANLFVLNFKAKEEFVISTENGITIVLDTTLDNALMLEGAYRELVRSAQVLRKEAEFNISDRVEMDIVSTSPFISLVIKTYGDKIAQEVLATSFNKGIAVADIEKEVEVADEKVIIKLKVAK